MYTILVLIDDELAAAKIPEGNPNRLETQHLDASSTLVVHNAKQKESSEMLAMVQQQ